MSETKYTKGPWEVHKVEYGDTVTDDLCILSASPDFRDVARVEHCFQGARDYEMEDANARLIAAAPELLEALIEARAEFYDHAHSSGDPDDINNMESSAVLYRQCAAAIKKATA